MLGALTFSISASSLGVLACSSRRTSTENWCGATEAVDSKRTRREMRMHAMRRSLVRRSRCVRVIEGRTGVVVGAMVVSSGGQVRWLAQLITCANYSTPRRRSTTE